MEKSALEKDNKNENKRKLITYLISFIILSILTVVVIYNGVSKRTTIVSYSESSLNDYLVCVRENEFYNERCIEKDKQYVASIIDYLDVFLKYNLKADEKLDFIYSYKINGKLVIYDRDNEKNELFTKDYEFVKELKKVKSNSNGYNIEENLKIDYHEYNNLAERFKKEYNIIGESKLIITLTVSTLGKYKDIEDAINHGFFSSVTIPLTEKTIYVSMDSQNANIKNEFSHIETKAKVILFILSVLMIIVLINLFRYVIYYYKKMIKEENKYDRFIRKLKNEYGRYIVETETLIDSDEYKLIEVKNFNELLDKARIREDNILCFESKEEISFMVIQQDHLYQKTYKRTDEEFK